MAVGVFLAVAEEGQGIVSAFLSEFFEYRLEHLFFEVALVLSYELFLIESVVRPVLDALQLTAQLPQPNVKLMVLRA